MQLGHLLSAEHDGDVHVDEPGDADLDTCQRFYCPDEPLMDAAYADALVFSQCSIGAAAFWIE